MEEGMPVEIISEEAKVIQIQEVEEMKSAKNSAKNSAKKSKKRLTRKQKIARILIILVVVGLAAAVGLVYYFASQNEDEANVGGRVEFADPIYSVLTGEEIADASLNNSPTFCVQIPNGNDGARPQAGLSSAAVVFEAIAEAGITRFAAIFQNTDLSAIGPVRSLRPYYLDWDTPFGCTVVHAGGSDEALAALRRGGQREMDENYTYMWRENNGARRWNNLFTSSADLMAYNLERGYNTSSIKAFSRLTPDEVEDVLLSQNVGAELGEEDGVIEQADAVTWLEIDFGRSTIFNTVYNYDSTTNTYLRSYANGDPHLVYNCVAGLERPNTATGCGELVQVNPSVVVAMRVYETNMSDNYHQNIKTIGSGEATIFQNGTVIEGTWEKRSQSEQIVFKDSDGAEIKLTPGQLWIAAVPQYGAVSW